MQKVILFVILLALGPGLVSAEDMDASRSNHADFVSWLWGSKDSLRQAIAIALDAGKSLPTSEVQSTLVAMIGSAQDQDLIEMLTAACIRADLLMTCTEAGLDKAIISNAGGNLFLWGHFFTTQGEWEDAIVEEPVISDAYWRVGWSIHKAYVEFVEIMSDTWNSAPYDATANFSSDVSSSLMIPLKPLVEVCTNPSDRLAGPCRAMEKRMQGSNGSEIEVRIGYALERERLLQAGDAEGVEIVKQRLAALDEHRQCTGQFFPEEFSEAWLSSLFEKAVLEGEFAAFDYLAAQAGGDCRLEIN
jgi:hypothetical protein